MISKPELFSVDILNIDGFSELSNTQINSGGFQIFLQKNEIEFGTQWQINIGGNLAILEIKANYEPVNKLDFSILASYKASQHYVFTDMQNLNNETVSIEKVIINFYAKLSNEYNKRLKGTKIEIPFPIMGQQQLDLVRQRVLLSLHKTLERLKTPPPK